MLLQKARTTLYGLDYNLGQKCKPSPAIVVIRRNCTHSCARATYLEFVVGGSAKSSTNLVLVFC